MWYQILAITCNNVSSNDPDDGPVEDNNNGWIDECEDMEEDELKDLEEKVQPIRFLLTKVGGNSSAVQY